MDVNSCPVAPTTAASVTVEDRRESLLLWLAIATNARTAVDLLQNSFTQGSTLSLRGHTTRGHDPYVICTMFNSYGTLRKSFVFAGHEQRSRIGVVGLWNRGGDN